MTENINIALLGNTTTEYIGNSIRSECSKYSIEALIYNAPFKQFNQVILDDKSDFYSLNPDLTILLLEGRELFPHWYDTAILISEEVDKQKMVQDMTDMLIQMIEKIHIKSKTKIIVNNFRVPYHSPLGIIDNRINIGLKRIITSLNISLEEYAAKTNYLYLFDFNGFCSYSGQNDILDEKMYYLAGCSLSFPVTKLLAREYMRFILPLRSRNKKCLVLDLDNTLWGGIAGEDGLSGIKLDISGEGKSFYDFQREIINLYNKGILLAINSKNNPEDALEIIENHPYMLLRKKYFACLKINWQDKASNLKEISTELNIGLDSLVFFDDNAIERELVKSIFPQALVVDVPEDTSKYCMALKNIVDFETIILTEEDIKRNEMYAKERERLEYIQSFQNKEEYLKSLDTKLTISSANEFNMPRIAQLTQKTNQFNMTTKRYQLSDIKSMLEEGEYLVLCCSVSDKFGDSGITGCCVVKLSEDAAHIDTYLLSCRILGRNIEYKFLSYIINLLKSKGIHKIYAEYLATEKNKANKYFYSNAGFLPISSDNTKIVFMFDEDCEEAPLEYIQVKVE